MLSAWTRIAIVVALAAIGLFALDSGRDPIAGFAAAVAVLMLWGLFRYASVQAAGRQYRAGRGESAWRLLRQVPFGGRTLARGHRTYYHLLRAACLLDAERFDDVLPEGQAVLDTADAGPANYAAAHGALARAQLARGDRDAAAHHLRAARELPHKPALDRLLSSVANELDGDDGEESVPAPASAT